MTESATLPDVTRGKQLSNKALQELARPYAIRAIHRLGELLESKQEAVAVSAGKTLLAKVLPDLKAIDLSTPDGLRFLIEIVQDNKLKDANKDNTVTGEELPSTGENLQLSDTIQDSQ